MNFLDAVRYLPAVIEAIDAIRTIVRQAGPSEAADAMAAVSGVLKGLEKLGNGDIGVAALHDELAERVKAYDTTKAELYRELARRFR